MKGYFSELARHTGIRIGSGVPKSVAPSPAPSAPPDSEVRGLEVEEVSFTSTSQPSAAAPATVETTATEVSGNISDRSDARRSKRPDSGRDRRSEPDSSADAQRIHETSNPTIEVTAVNFTDSDSGANRNLLSTDLETRVSDHPRVVISPLTSLDEQTSAPGEIAESLSALELRNATSAPEFDFADQRREVSLGEADQRRDSRSTEQSETGFGERVERQLVVRNYLKEISEWISTPVVAEEQSASLTSEDSGASAGDLARRAERMNISPVSTSDRSRTGAPEQQDLTLSIGTIKIVIEEPRVQAPVSTPSPVPPPNTERTFERTPTAPTDLSRYYIHRW